MELTRRSFATLAGGALTGGILGAPYIARGQAALKEVLVTAPQSLFAHLPVHAGIVKGFFEAEGLKVRVLDMETGTQHTNAVLSGQAFAFIGGPEHNAYAALKGAQLRAICNMVNRNNNYMVARTGLKIDPNDLASSLRDKKIASNFYGSTVNSTVRYLCLKAGLKLGEDVTLVEMTQGGSLVAMKSGQVDIAMVSEPVLTKGVRGGIWQEPFWKGADFGPYAYTVISTAKETMDKDPKTVASFVKGVVEGLKYVNAHHDDAIEIERKTFPQMQLDDIKVTLDRCFADQLWAPDGQISQDAWQNAEKIVLAAGLLKQQVPYGDVIDMRFVNA